jgi:hypothetical protein
MVPSLFRQDEVGRLVTNDECLGQNYDALETKLECKEKDENKR